MEAVKVFKTPISIKSIKICTIINGVATLAAAAEADADALREVFMKSFARKLINAVCKALVKLVKLSPRLALVQH